MARGGKGLLPGARPRRVQQGTDLGLGRRPGQTERAERGAVGPDGGHESGRGRRLGEEGAQPRGIGRCLLLDHAEGALLPEKVREPVGGLGRGGDRELPERHQVPKSFFIRSTNFDSRGPASSSDTRRNSSSTSFWRARQARRNLDDHLVVEVALAPPAEVRHALALQDQALARLRARRHRQLRLALEDRHLDGVAEGRLRKGDRQLGDQMRSLADEELVGADVDHDVEIARRAAELAGLALAGEPELIAVFHAGGDRHLEQPLPALTPFDPSTPCTGTD